MHRSRSAVATVLALLGVFAGCGDGSEEQVSTVTKTTIVESAPSPEQLPPPQKAVEYVRRFYRLIDGYRYGAAWPLLPASVQEEAGGFVEWRRGYRANITTQVATVDLRDAGGNTATVAVELWASDLDACSGRKVRQEFSGIWDFVLVRNGWIPREIAIEPTSGEAPTVRVADCPRFSGGGLGGGGGRPLSQYPPGDPAPDYSYDNDRPYPDVDCSDVAGPIYVGGDDPHGLDADGDGVGCE
jgi:hypothetical protein